ncbi:MAG: caspase family protein [Rhodospirillaceae bacterium]|nr:caspase family protein [Rhodospirillales bacterium]
MMNRFQLATMAVVLLLGLTVSGAWAAGTEKRVALVIGNGTYRNTASLKNSVNDARLMAETFRALGFRLIGDGPLIDAERPAMEQAIRSFGKALREGAVGVFYYSGHGLQVKGTNYMAPVSAKVTGESDVKYELVDVGFVLDEMGNAGNRLNIVILDACRNNPLSASGMRSVGDGLATMTAPAGTAIAFATQPGNVARDGAGSHSPYTEALAKAIRTPGLDLFDTFNEVGLAVKKSTGSRQQPWLSSSPIEGTFYFAGPGRTDSKHYDNSADIARAKAEVDRLKREADEAKADIMRANADAAEIKRRQADDDARVEAKRRQADADAVEELRGCRDEAKANAEASAQLKRDFDSVKHGWDMLQIEKQSLETTISLANNGNNSTDIYFSYMAKTKQNAYDEHYSRVYASAKEYKADNDALSARIDNFNSTCQKRWSKRVVDEACSDSDDSFCSRLLSR